MDGPDAQYRPVLVESRTDPSREFWVIDGKLRARSGNIGRIAFKESRELSDVAARLRHMDQLGTDIQVIYPSLWTSVIFSRPEAEVAVCRSYNRWLGDGWRKGSGRLRWVAVLPLMSIDKAVEEMNAAKESGACAVLHRAFEGNRHPSDPYFFPLYEEASRLDLAVCFHAGIGSAELFDLYDRAPGGGSFMKFKLSVISAFDSIVTAALPARFPDLRFGFIEVSAQWIPYLLHALARLRGEQKRSDPINYNLLRENRLYVACQLNDDLPHVLKYAGEDNIVLGTDYGHSDSSTELTALQTLREECPVPRAAVEKILDANPRALYGL
jgi:predicted TIM-barrel fold metal-dependent hydrolase